MISLKHKKYVVIITIGNYLINLGGTNKVVFTHQKMLNENGYSVVCVYPSLYTRKSKKHGMYWGVIIDGNDCGIYDTDDIIRLSNQLSANGYKVHQVIIHHLKGMHIVDVCRLIKYYSVETVMYIHDFYTACPQNYQMLESDGRACPAKRMGDDRCNSCKFYSGDCSLELEICDMLIDQNLVDAVIAPAEYTMEKWKKSFPEYKGQTRVILHQVWNGIYDGNCNEIKENEPLRIGYVGAPKAAKGWEYWQEAIKQAHDKGCNEEFHTFGMVGKNPDYVVEHEVRFQKGLNSMIDALRTEQIHCAVLWSVVKETYSYTYYESTAANAFVITSPWSGNIAVEVKKRGNGVVGENLNSMGKIFLDEQSLRSMVNQYRKKKILVPGTLIENDEILRYISEEGRFCTTNIPRRNTKAAMIHFILNIDHCGYLMERKIKECIKKMIYSVKKGRSRKSI